MNFSFSSTPRIIFGNGSFTRLKALIEEFQTKNILFITGTSSFRESLKWNDLVSTCKELHVNMNHATISGEPSPGIIDEICHNFNNEDIGLVISIGGGSVLDAGKAISAMLTKKDSVLNYLEGIGTKQHDGEKIPFIAVPSSAGTGSETTKNAVISKIGENGFKKSLRHDNFIPNIALVDPGLTLSLPPGLTAACGMDAFSQLLESYVSNNGSVLTDSLAKKALKLITKSLPLVVKNGNDINARSEVSYAAMISGITLANAGLGAIHGLASQLGGYFKIPHGVVCGTLLHPANELNINKLKKKGGENIFLHKYSEIGKMMSGTNDKNQDYYLDFFLATIEKWTKDMELPLLDKYGITRNDISKIVKGTSIKNNPVELNESELAYILERRLR
ncbi:MAG: iron-containing alcohol dehydrogenase [bacterium]